jgi:hypothetical protein
MTLLPATFQQAEVAEVARVTDQLVWQCLTEDLLQIGAPMLDPNVGAIDWCRNIKLLFEDNPFYRPHILRAAFNGFTPAQMALRELVVEMCKEDWPNELEAFAVAWNNPRFHWPSGKRGAKRLSHLYFDIAVIMVLRELSKRFPNIPVTSRSARRVCLCDHLAGALNKHSARHGRGQMNRFQLKQIWKARKQYQIHGISDPKVLHIFNMLSG